MISGRRRIAAALFIAAALRANGIQSSPAPPPPGSQSVTYVGGQLTIHALGLSVTEVLARVAALTGVKIDVPEGANAKVMPAVQLGPGPPCQILSSLLSDLQFDYLIQASEADPEKLEGVLIMPRRKSDGGNADIDAAARPPLRSPFSRAAAPPPEAEESTASDTPDPAPAESAPSPSTQPDVPAAALSSSPRDQSNVTSAAALSPPPALTPQNINTQLQQMYQQRMQMIQQDRQNIPQPAPQR